MSSEQKINQILKLKNRKQLKKQMKLRETTKLLKINHTPLQNK